MTAPQRTFTDEEILDIRAALLTASWIADNTLNAATGPSGEDRNKLEAARWRYLTLAERIAG